MKRDRESLLDGAVNALRADVPDHQLVSDSAARSAHALGIVMNHESIEGAIQDCAGVQRLFGPYRAGTLPPGRKLLVDAHLHDCGVCLRALRGGRTGGTLDWSAPAVVSSSRRPAAWGWAMAVTAALFAAGLFAYKAYWQVPPGVRAEVQSINGEAYLIDRSGNHRLAPGAKLSEGAEIRTAGDSQAVLQLSDGSVVEASQRSTFGVGARGHDMTVNLRRGALIVQAAHRAAGHLYVKTPDCRVAVTGTVFSVNAGIKGSRVSVLQGSVHVTHAGIHSLLLPGEQLATSENLAPEPLANQFSWSADRQKYIEMVAQAAVLGHRLAQIPFPDPRYSSDLLARVPADTVLYVSIPNLGEFLKEANSIFQDQLNASPALLDWWTKAHGRNPEQLNEFVSKIEDISQYLGDEVVFIGLGQQGDRSGVAMIADVERSGLKEELQQQFDGGPGNLMVLDPASLAAAGDAAGSGRGGYALVRDHEIVFANSIATLKKLNAQLDAGASGFGDSDFGKQIAAAYGRGAGIILAANLHSILQSGTDLNTHRQQALANTGLDDLDYLIAEHRETNGMPANHLDLQFTGTRQRMASWLASPGPIGSLDFVSPNASVAFATLTRDPAMIADDLMAMASQARGAKTDWSEIDSKLQFSVRDDLVASLGGDFTVALDGPVLPTPSWKLVIEVNNPATLETALERLTTAIQSNAQGPKAHLPGITVETVGSQRYYAVRDLTTGIEMAEYTFADGFLIAAPNRALLMDALQTHANGDSLAHSSGFRSLLPRDENENYSSVLYQNLSPVLTPLLSQFSGEAGQAIQELASDSRPTVICAQGEESRIEASSDSRLFGFDFLTLSAILDSRNKQASPRVMH